MVFVLPGIGLFVLILKVRDRKAEELKLELQKSVEELASDPESFLQHQVASLERRYLAQTMNRHDLKCHYAKKEYDESLQRLSKDPTDSDLREITLKLGRAYYGAARLDGRLTIYDKVVPKNDLDTVTAANSDRPRDNLNMRARIEDRLKSLQSLLDAALIDEDEYAGQRHRILDSV